MYQRTVTVAAKHKKQGILKTSILKTSILKKKEKPN